jgi:hypothetical protein
VFYNVSDQGIKTIMSAALKGCKTLSLILMEEFVTQVFKIKWQGIHLHLQNIMYNDNLGYLIKWESEINNATLSWACD